MPRIPIVELIKKLQLSDEPRNHVNMNTVALGAILREQGRWVLHKQVKRDTTQLGYGTLVSIFIRDDDEWINSAGEMISSAPIEDQILYLSDVECRPKSLSLDEHIRSLTNDQDYGEALVRMRARLAAIDLQGTTKQVDSPPRKISPRL